MDLLVVVYASLLALGCITYYIWYLTWPVVEGQVENVSRIVIKGIAITRPKEFRIVRYSYNFYGKECSASKQSLFTKRGFSPRVGKGDKILVSVCADLPFLTCPRRALFDGFLLMLIVMFCSVTAAMAYMSYIRTS